MEKHTVTFFYGRMPKKMEPIDSIINIAIDYQVNLFNHSLFETMKKFVNKIKATNGYQEQKVFFQQKIDAEKARIVHKLNEKEALAQQAAQDPAPQETQDHAQVAPAPQEAAVAHQPLVAPALEAGKQTSDELAFEMAQLLAKPTMSHVTASDLNEMLIDIVKAISTELDTVELDDMHGTDTDTDTEMVVAIGTMPELPL